MPRVALCHIIDIIACELVNKKDNIFVLIIPDIISYPKCKERLLAGIDFNTCFFCVKFKLELTCRNIHIIKYLYDNLSEKYMN